MIAFKVFQKIYKTVFFPFLISFFGFFGNRISMILFLALGRKLGLKNVQFDFPFEFPIKESENKIIYSKIAVQDDDISVLPFLASRRNWECEEPILAYKILQHSMADNRYVILDLGANYGFFTQQLMLLIKSCDYTAAPIQKAVLFEPDNRLTPIIKMNLAFLLPEVEVEIIGKPVTETGGEVEFIVDQGNSTMNSMSRDALEITQGKLITRRVSSISASSLCTFIPNDDKVRVLYKSDIQGYDVQVLGAISDSLLQKIDILIFEYWQKDKLEWEKRLSSLNNLFKRFPFVTITNRKGKNIDLNNTDLKTILESLDTYDFLNVLCSRFK